MNQKPAQLSRAIGLSHNCDRADDLVVLFGQPETVGGGIICFDKFAYSRCHIAFEGLVQLMLLRIKDAVETNDGANVARFNCGAELHWLQQSLVFHFIWIKRHWLQRFRLAPMRILAATLVEGIAKEGRSLAGPRENHIGVAAFAFTD